MLGAPNGSDRGKRDLSLLVSHCCRWKAKCHFAVDQFPLPFDLGARQLALQSLLAPASFQRSSLPQQIQWHVWPHDATSHPPLVGREPVDLAHSSRQFDFLP